MINHKTKIISLLLIFPFIQGCYMYKPVPINELKTGKHYKVQINDGRKIEHKLLNISKDSLKFIARDTHIQFSKTAIQSIKKRRASPVLYVVAAASITTIIFTFTADRPEPVFKIPE